MTDTSAVAPVATKLLYKPEEAAQVLGIGRSTLYLLLADSTIPSVRIGTSRRIRAVDLADFAASLPTVPLSAPVGLPCSQPPWQEPGAASDPVPIRGARPMAHTIRPVVPVDPDRGRPQ